MGPTGILIDKKTKVMAQTSFSKVHKEVVCRNQNHNPSIVLHICQTICTCMDYFKVIVENWKQTSICQKNSCEHIDLLIGILYKKA